MTTPVTYLEINSPEPERTRRFFNDVFDWEFQPFASPDYLVAPAGDVEGIDTGLLASRDGSPRSVPVIRVSSIEATLEAVEAHGGSVVVPIFEVAGVGRGAYFTDPEGVLVGVHQYDRQP